MKSLLMSSTMALLIVATGSPANGQCPGTQPKCGDPVGNCYTVEVNTQNLSNQTFPVTITGQFVNAITGNPFTQQFFHSGPQVTNTTLPQKGQLTQITVLFGDSCQGIVNPNCDSVFRGCNDSCFKVSAHCVPDPNDPLQCKIVIEISDESPCPPGTNALDGTGPSMAFRKE